MKKFLSLVLALAMILSLFACTSSNPTPTQTPSGSNNTPPAVTTPDGSGEDNPTDDTPTLGEYVPVTYNMDEIYDTVLGEFYDLYMEAKQESNLSMRWAKMALAEGKFMASGATSFTICKGGNYAFGRVAPKTVTGVLYGNDSDRFHQYIVTEQIITSEDRAAMTAHWNEVRGTGTYEAWAKDYLTTHNYTIKDTYNYEGYDSDPATWDILNSSEATDAEILVNTYDGLMEYDIENVQQPALATSVEEGETTVQVLTYDEDGEPILDDDGNFVTEEKTVPTFTFKIREGAIWTDSQGRRVADVTADDWVAGMEHLYDCGAGLEDLLNGVIYNGTEYNNGIITDFSQVGVKAVDTYTLQYTLAAPCPYFLTMLGYSMFAPMSRTYYTSQGGKFGDDFDPSASTYNYGKSPSNIAYNGPYLISGYTSKNSIVFSLSDSYWNKDNINIKTLTWLWNDGSDSTKAYEDVKSGVCDGSSLSAETLELAKQEKMPGDDETIFEKYHYNSATDATTYFGWLNLNRLQWANYNDNTKLVSEKSHASADEIDLENEVYTSDILDDAARSHAALNNKSFRLAMNLSMDRAAYNALRMGEELKLSCLINSVVPGNFCYLEEDVTVSVNGKETKFPAGTAYGEIVQAQIDAEGLPMQVFNKETGESVGYDGWYHPDEAKAYMAQAVKELAAQGIEITKENPIILDSGYYSGSTMMTNQAQLLKQTYETIFDGLVQINLQAAAEFDDFNRSTYWPDTGDQMNFDIAYGSTGWGPDYGDPATWLDCFLPYGEGYMAKNLGLY